MEFDGVAHATSFVGQAPALVFACRFTLRQAIPSAQRDPLSCFADIRALLSEAQYEAA